MLHLKIKSTIENLKSHISTILKCSWSKNSFSTVGTSSGASGKKSPCQCKRCERYGFDPWVRNIRWSRKWQPTPVFLPGKFPGLRSLAGYSPWGLQRVRHDWVHIHSLRYPHFFIFIFNWGKIAPQCCISFCRTTVEISHNYTFITSLLSLLPLPQAYPSGSSESTWLGSLCYTATYPQLSVLHMGV